MNCCCDALLFVFLFVLSGIDWSGESYNYPVLGVIQYARPQPTSHKTKDLIKQFTSADCVFLILLFTCFLPSWPTNWTSVDDSSSLWANVTISPRFLILYIHLDGLVSLKSFVANVLLISYTLLHLRCSLRESDVLPLTLYPSFRHLQTCPLRLWHCSYGEIDKCIKLRFCCIIKFSYLT